MANVLYLTYDGLGTPPAYSQIIPYIVGLTKLGHSVHLVSTEPGGRIAPEIARRLRFEGIRHDFVPYTERYKPFHAFYNLFRLKKLARRVLNSGKFDLIHARSQLAAAVGNQIRGNKGIKLLYDMRGFWADERVEGGIWNTERFIYRKAYQHYKRQEAELLAAADETVVLTWAARNFLLQNRLTDKPITVIPCCTDLDKFNPQRFSPESRTQVRTELQISENSFLWIYVGSLGTWYPADEMIRFFEDFRRTHPDSYFLFLTKDRHVIEEKLSRLNDRSVYRAWTAKSDDVPAYIYASDAGLCFIRPSFSKTGSSPIKLSELWAMNLPTVCNGGYGDMDFLKEEYELQAFFTDSEYRMPEGFVLPNKNFRLIAQTEFSSDLGIYSYDRIYRRLTGES